MDKIKFPEDAQAYQSTGLTQIGQYKVQYFTKPLS